MIVIYILFLQTTPSRVDDKEGDKEDGSASKNLNRSSSFLFESLYDSSLLAGLSPNQVLDQSDEEEADNQDKRQESPFGLADQRRRNELLANQEAEQQEAIRWGESSFSLSEWGDSLLVGEHFLERQSMLKGAERSLKDRHDEDRQIQKPIQTVEGTCTKAALFNPPLVQNGPDSTLYCSPGLQEIFDRWPSMSDQPCTSADAVLDLPQASAETRKRGNEHLAASESDPHEEQLSGHGSEDATERPGSVNDLIPPTQERPPVTPRVKLTTSYVQSPLAAPPLKQSTPLTVLQPKPAVTECPKAQPGHGGNLSTGGQVNVPSDSNRKHQEVKPFPFPHPGSRTNPQLADDPSVGVNRDCPSPSSSRPHFPSKAESPLANEGFTLQLSPDASLCSSGAFSIIDVASDRRLFQTFTKEWKTKDRYCLALACERREPLQQPDGEMGWKPDKGRHCSLNYFELFIIY